MPQDSNKDRTKRYNAAKAQALLKEYGEFIMEVINETSAEYSQEINELSVEALAIRYSKNQGGRQALQLFMKKLNSKASDI